MVKIIVIEDEEDLLNDIAMWLQFQGFETVTAANGERGLELVKALKPDLILCDINMPLMDGFEVLTEVRSLPDVRHTPFLFLTAQSDYQVLRIGMLLGADDYITKPFDYPSLLNAINLRLKKQQDIKDSLLNKVSHLMVNHVDNMRQELVNYLEDEISPTLKSLLFYTQGTNQQDNQTFTQHLSAAMNAIEYLHVRLVPDLLINLGIPAMLDWLILQYERLYTLKITFEYRNITAHCSIDLTRNLFYMVDELLKNVVLHSQTQQADIHLQQVNDVLYCSVTDKGTGFDVSDFWENATTFGLVLARERSRMFGGELEILSDNGGGTTVNFFMNMTTVVAKTQNTPALRYQLPDTSPHLYTQTIISVVIFHHENLLLRGLQQVLATETDITVAASGSNSAALFNLFDDGLKFDVLIMSLTLANSMTDEQAGRIFEHTDRIIIIGEGEEQLANKLADATKAYLTEAETVSNLCKVIRAVQNDKTYKMVLTAETSAKKASPLDVLTQREREILEYVANNRQNADIAEELVISIRTVETHRANMMRKLDLKDKSELILFALKHGVISLGS